MLLKDCPGHGRDYSSGSRGGFERIFTLDESIDANNITAKYVDGVLEVSLPLIPGKPPEKREIIVN